MPLTVLNVAYPLAPVAPDTAGGAEQVVRQLDLGLVAAGHQSLVIACAGSWVRGRLFELPPPPEVIDEAAQRRAQGACRALVAAVLQRCAVDLVHLHGIDFAAYLPPEGVPALVTLHLPPDWYPWVALRPARPATYLHCVSLAQHRACPPGTALLPPIPNGVDLPQSVPPLRRRFALMLGRICPEKGFHVGIDAARRARVPALLAGHVFGYPAHEVYFRDEIRPRLGPACRFLGPVGGARKARLFAAARCLLVPSRVAETSSFVAMEALASGTPVVAFKVGALPEIVEHGRTGFLVEDEREMAEAVAAAAALSPDACRDAARQRFAASRMVERYLARYERLAHRCVSGVDPLELA
jgi:glycosyltransferase involved in cell wall biosynthesis